VKRIFSYPYRALVIGAIVLGACARATPTPVTVEVTKEVQTEVTRIVEMEVTAPAPVVEPEAPRELTALVGAGLETTTINAFFPESLHIRAGDTVIWKYNSDELHTVSFVSGIPAEDLLFAVPMPGGPEEGFMVNPMLAFPTRFPGAPVEVYSGDGFASSGFFSKEPPAPDVPPNDTFTLTFDTPGVYKYLCLVHEEFMPGSVVVESATATDVPSQEEIDGQVEAEIDSLLAGIEAAKEAGGAARTELGPNDTTLWHVKAGILDITTVDPRGEALEFLPKDLTIQAGDTVVWGSTGFHTITFDPAPPPPEFVIPVPQEGGPPLLTLNPEVGVPARPSAVYDPAQYFNSADIGPFSLGGASWALTFEEPGTFDYFCAVHREQGMKGTITVEAP